MTNPSTTAPQAIDANLPSWEEVQGQDDWSGILIGNGASRAIWEPFRYSSLFDKSKSNEIAHPITPQAEAVFQQFQTENFEAVLSRLRDASAVCAAFNIAHGPIDANYESIKRALIESVHAVHIRWPKVPHPVKTQVREALLPFDYVYSTNYDLLLYWAMMADDAAGFKDYFWNPEMSFDPTNTEVWVKCTKVLYLHGGLHIYKLPSGLTVKRDTAAGNLLDRFGQPYHGVDIPLFISEGQAADKLAAIRRSEYLSFAITRFAEHRGPLVVFGHSLSPSDQHIVRIIQQYRVNRVSRIAIAVVPAPPQDVIARKAALMQLLPGQHLVFFNSHTHPLGAEALQQHG